jgi:glycosyltransferase involved in cell wall biosynthesis
MMKIKVLNVITGGLISDGITSSWLSFCEAINKDNLDDDVQIDFAFIEGVSENSIEEKFHSFGCNTPHLPSRMKNPLHYTKELIHLLKAGGYSIVHTNGSSSLLCFELYAGWRAAVKVRIAHSRNTNCSFKALHRFLKIPFSWLCNGRIACGQDAGRWLFGDRNFTILHNGKDFSKFCYSEHLRVETREKLLLKDKFVIGHVGKFNEQKNHRFLVDIFEEVKSEIPNSILYLIGDGPLLEDVKRYVDDKNLSTDVVFAGAINDVHKRLNAMDVMVFPSLFEGLPNVVLEWQAMGLPCIVSSSITRECAPSNLVRFLNLSQSANEWAKEVLAIYNSKYDRVVQSKEGTLALQKAGFDISKNAEQLMGLYKSMYEQMYGHTS